MKFFPIKLGSLFILLCFAINAQANDQADWTRIITEDKNLSVAFPPNFVVDAEKRSKSNQTHQIFGSQNDIDISLKVLRSKNSVERLKNNYNELHETSKGYFKNSNFTGYRYIASKNSTEIIENIELVSDNYFYLVKIKARNTEKEKIEPFLYSILIDGKPFFNAKELESYSGKFVSIDSLKTNSEVIEAYGREIKRLSQMVKTKPYMDNIYTDNKGFSRPAFILGMPQIEFDSKKLFYNPDSRLPHPNLPEVNKNPESYNAKILVQLLSNGEIGVITIYGTSHKGFVKACVDAIEKLRFVPAQKNGVNVNSKIILSYNYLEPILIY